MRFGLRVHNKFCNFIALYISPSQSQDQFKSFEGNAELNLESAVQNNSFLVVLLGDCNAKLSNWCKNGMTTNEGKAMENINEPTHVLESSSSCIELIFTSQRNVTTESVVNPPLYSNSHHQIIFAKFNLEILFLLPYF